MPKNILLQNLLKHIKESGITLTDDELKKLFTLKDENIATLLNADNFEIRFHTILFIIDRPHQKKHMDFVLSTKDVELLSCHANESQLFDFICYYNANIGRSHQKLIDQILKHSSAQTIGKIYELNLLIKDHDIYEFVLNLAANNEINDDNINRILNFFKGNDKDIFKDKKLVKDLIGFLLRCEMDDIVIGIKHKIHFLSIGNSERLINERNEFLEALIKNQKSLHISKLLLKLIQNVNIGYYYPAEYIRTIEKYGDNYPDETAEFVSRNHEFVVDWSESKGKISEKELDIERAIIERLIVIPVDKKNITINSRYKLLNDLTAYSKYYFQDKERFPNKHNTPRPNFIEYFPAACEYDITETRLISFIALLNRDCSCVDIIKNLIDLVIAHRPLSSPKKEKIIASIANRLFYVIKFSVECQNAYQEYLGLFKYILLADDNNAEKIAKMIDKYIDELTPGELQRILEASFASEEAKTVSIKKYSSTENKNNIDEMIEALELYDAEKNIEPNDPIVVCRPKK